VRLLQPTPEEARSTCLADVTDVLRDTRTDPEVRIVVFTGPESVDKFYASRPSDEYYTEFNQQRLLADETHAPLDRAMLMANGMIETEKIVVSKVNGDSFGSGTSLLFGSDFVAAEKDAHIAEIHMDMRETDPERRYAPEGGVVPGGLAGRCSRCTSRRRWRKRH